MRSLLLASSALLMSACTTLGPNFETPAAPKSAGYAMQGDAAGQTPARLGAQASDAAWWTSFNSAQLNELVEQALAANPTLEAQEAALQRAQALEAAANNASDPQVSLTASANRQRINTAGFGISGFPSPTINIFSVGPRVSFDLDPFGRLRRIEENAAATTEAQARRRDAAYLSLSGNVVARAIELASLRAQLSEVEAIIKSDQETLARIQRAVAAGGAPQSATNVSDAQLAEDEARRPALQKRLDATRHALAALAGKSPSEWTAPEIDLAELALPAAIPVSLPSDLVRKRPDILAAEADLHAATASVGVAAAERYPSLSLDANFILTALNPEDIFKYESSGWAIGPSLAAPIFRGKSPKARQAAAEAAVRQADAQYRQTVLTALVQVADLLAAISSDQSLVEAQSRANDAAQENARLASIAYENGAGSLISVLDAQRQAQRAQLGAVDAQAQLRADIAALQVATAAKWRTNDTPAKQPQD